MICQASDLCAVLDFFQVVPQRTGVLTSEFFRLRCGRGKLAVALGSEVFGEFEINAKVDPQSWEFFVNRKLLRNFVSKTDEEVHMTPNNPKTPTKLRVRIGKRHAAFDAPEFIEGYGAAPQEKMSLFDLRADQIEQIRLAAAYTLDDPDARQYSQIYLDSASGSVIAANRLSYLSAVCGIENDGAVPASFSKLLALNARLRISSKGVKLTYSDGYLYQCFSSGDFPLKQIRKFFRSAEDWPTQIEFDAREFRETVKRLRVFDRTEGTLIVRKEAKDREAALTVEGEGSVFVEHLEAKSKAFLEEFLIPSILPLVETAPAGARLLVSFVSGSPYLFHYGNTSDGRRVISPRRKK